MYETGFIGCFFTVLETSVGVACANVNKSLQSIVLLSKDSARVIRGTCICKHFQDSLSDCIVIFTIQVSSDKWCVPGCVHCFVLHIAFQNFQTELSSSKLSRTYLLTPWSSAHLENLTGSQLVKKFPAVYVTRRFIRAFAMPATCPYPEPDQSSPCPSIPLPEDPS